MGSRWEHWDQGTPILSPSALGGYTSLLHWPQLTSSFFFFFNIYLAVSGLSCDSQDIRSLLQHVGCLVVAYELRVVAWSILVLLTRNRTWAPCTWIMESTTEPPGKSQLTSFGLHLYLHNLCSPGSLPLSWELNL